VIVERLSKGAGPTTLVHLSCREVLNPLTRKLAGSFVLLCAEKARIADDESQMLCSAQNDVDPLHRRHEACTILPGDEVDDNNLELCAL